MLRKIFKITLIIICIGFISAFIRGFTYQNNKSNKDLINQDQTSKQNLIDEEVISSILNTNEIEESLDNEKITETKEEVKKKSSNTKVETKTSEIKEINVNNNNKVQIQENVSNEDTTQNEEDSSSNETIIKDSVPTTHEEYNNLLNYVDYTSDEYSICYSDSINVALTDTVNIRNTACKQFAYNGELIGYKIQIFYRDGTYEYYKN